VKCRLCVKTHVRERVPGSALGTTGYCVCVNKCMYKHYGLEVHVKI